MGIVPLTPLITLSTCAIGQFSGWPLSNAVTVVVVDTPPMDCVMVDETHTCLAGKSPRSAGTTIAFLILRRASACETNRSTWACRKRLVPNWSMGWPMALGASIRRWP